MLQDSEDSNNNLYSIKKNKNEIKAGRIFLSKTKARYLLGQICFTLFQRSLLLTLLLLQVMGQGMIFQNSEVSTHWTRKQSQENQHQEKKKTQKPKPKKKHQKSYGGQGSIHTQTSDTLSTSQGLDLCFSFPLLHLWLFLHMPASLSLFA